MRAMPSVTSLSVSSKVALNSQCIDTPMAESPPNKTKTVRDWINRPYGDFSAAERRCNELWQALSAFIH
jgi:hypothetical protein